VIRRATPADADAIAAVQSRAWRHAFADIVEADRMPVASEQGPRFAGHIAHGGDVHVFDQDGRVAGFTVLAGDQLHALYVDPPAQGAGVGTALLAAAVDALRAAGRAEAFLWTFEANGLARAFYERHGWELVPGHDDHLGAPEVRYRLTLSPPTLEPGTEPPGGETPWA
jgi:GNAT superfamily N-acetyltransferase